MANRFRDPTMRQQYDVALRVYDMRHRDLFLPSGERRRQGTIGSSFAGFFWRGYDGERFGAGWDAASKKTLAYAYWRAGQDARKLRPLAETDSTGAR